MSERNPAKSVSVRFSVFKYYIHDGIEECRLQLLGDLSEADVAELSGCWNTARTTLGKRRLMLDLRALKSADDAGREWLLAMVREGAHCLPETYFRDHLTTNAAANTTMKKQVAGRLARLGSIFRGGREIGAEASTRVR